ncbi:restriction endonuclease [Aerolutibacter ruishenii]|nr:restriction endonuclease [Lysobacter ruishenii]
MDPLAFERLMGDYYRGLGYKVDGCGTGGRASQHDGGIDLKLYKDGEYTVVQCKRENANQVTHNVMHQLLGVMLTEGAHKAVVITTGEFTDAAWSKAKNDARMQLIDGTKLRDMLGPLLPADAAPSPVTPSLAASYWGLSAPYRERVKAEREPAGGRPSRRRKKQDDASGLVVVAAVVLAMLVWQCSRKAPAPVKTSSRPAQVQPAVTERPVSATSPTQRKDAVAPTQRNDAVAPTTGQSHRVAPPSGAYRSDEEAVKAYLEAIPEM